MLGRVYHFRPYITGRILRFSVIARKA